MKKDKKNEIAYKRKLEAELGSTEEDEDNGQATLLNKQGG